MTSTQAHHVVKPPAKEAAEHAHHAALDADQHSGIDLLALDREVRNGLNLAQEAPLSRELLGGGLSQTTIRYRFESGSGLATAIVRIPPAHGPLEPYSPEGEAALMQWLRGHGVKVPQVLYCSAATPDLERGFLISEEVKGDVVRDGAFGYSEEEKRALADDYLNSLVSFHSLGNEPRSIEVLGWAPAKNSRSVVERWITALSETDLRLPDFHQFLTDWLTDRMPAAGADTVVHGDYRLANVLWHRPGEMSAILDWEEAGAGDPYFDLGWTLMGTDAPDDQMMGVLSRAEFLSGYERLSGHEVDHERLLWWEVAAGWSRLCMEAKAIALISQGHYADLRPLLSTYINRRLSIVLLEKIQRYEGATRIGLEQL